MEQLLLFSLEPKIKRAIENLKIFEETALRMHPNGYYLSFSGGKDSQVIYRLAEMAGIRFEPHYHITTVDPPELVEFIMKTYGDVIRDRPAITMWDLIVKKHFPPTRKIRYCCSEFKESGGKDRFTVTGVRWAESAKRKAWNLAQISDYEKTVILFNNDNHEKRKIIESCVSKGKFMLNPIIDWTASEVWSFIHRYIGTYCCLYDCGFSRLGCIGCPLASVRQRKWELARYPKYKHAYLKTFERMIKERPFREAGDFKHWETAEEVYYWWLYGSRPDTEQVSGQLNLDLDNMKYLADEDCKDNIMEIYENMDGQMSIFDLAS